MKRLIACVSGIALLTLAACGDSGGMGKEQAGRLLKAAVIDAPIVVHLPTVGAPIERGFDMLYQKQFPIIKTLPLRMDNHLWRIVGLNEVMIDKNGWKQYLAMDGDDLVITNYYVSFLEVTGVIDPANRGACNVIAEYKVSLTKETPWTAAYLESFAEKHGSPKTDIYTACLVKYSDGWRVTQIFMD